MRTRVGYAGGAHPSPTYHDMGDHTEAFAVDFDPRVVTYDALLAEFWASHDPRRAPYSRQYMTAAFPSPAQLDRAIASRPAGAQTPVVAHARFFLAEDYHQKYYLRHDKQLMTEFATASPRDFVDSTLAARLNAFAAGHGLADAAGLGLSPATLAYVASKSRRSAVSCG